MIGSLISSTRQMLPCAASLSQTCFSVFRMPAIMNSWSLTLCRTKMRYHFPRPSEYRRIKRQGWEARMATLGGRKILMRRILKGRYVLSH